MRMGRKGQCVGVKTLVGVMACKEVAPKRNFEVCVNEQFSASSQHDVVAKRIWSGQHLCSRVVDEDTKD